LPKQKTAIIIQGPTAVGKTAIAIAVARHFDTAIVSADSRQCYMGMPIGTAQPTAAELAQAKHYFINEFPVDEPLTAAGYEQLALGYINEVLAAHDTVVVCGGTGLYIKALCEGMDEMPPVNEAINQDTEATYKEQGIEWLQQAVKIEDPAFFASGEVQNPARLLRALVFMRSTGQSILQYRTGTRKARPFNIVKVGLELPREALYERINSRVGIMVQDGLLDEVKALYSSLHLKNLQTVGYTELFDFLSGLCTLPEAIEKIKQHTRNYAKRQMTWFKKDPEIHWLRADDKDVVGQIATLAQL
jgi:tRNA dimethylallyltransferase